MRESLSPFDTYLAGSVYRQEEEKKECSHCRIYFRWIVGTHPLFEPAVIKPDLCQLPRHSASTRRFFYSGGHNHHPVSPALKGWPGRVGLGG